MLLANSVLSDADEDVTFFTFSQWEDCFPDLQKNVHVVPWFGKVLKLAWKLRNYDLIICGNPPMQFVAALAKLFGNKAHVVWWHHHVPWYSMENSKFKIQNSKWKGEICPPDKAIDSEANWLKSAQARRGGWRGVLEWKISHTRSSSLFCSKWHTTGSLPACRKAGASSPDTSGSENRDDNPFLLNKRLPNGSLSYSWS